MNASAQIHHTSGQGAQRVRSQLGARRVVPWGGPAAMADWVLLGGILTVVALGLALRPAKPFLIAEHPVLLEFLTGDLVAVGAAAAFARIGEAPLALVIVAGAVGMVKFDLLTWWAGRRWGEGILGMLSTPAQAATWTRRLDRTRPWVMGLAVAMAAAPGVPTAVVYVLAGWAGMRLTTFLLLDLTGALAITALVSGLGYGLGQHAVDAVLLVDRHASTVTLVLIGIALVAPLAKKLIDRVRRQLTTSPTNHDLITKETP